MNELPGNIYAKLADDQMNYVYESGQVEDADQGTKVLFQAMNAIVQSNLAIAYEQRTANLIERERMLEEFHGYNADRSMQEEILERLGDTNE